jgi:hypothetical protein
MFTPLAQTGGELSFRAAFEQMLVHYAFFYERNDVVQQILDVLGGGTIVAFRYDSATLPPSWIILRQGNELWIHTTGTVNQSQWIGNIAGVISSPYPPFSCQAHSFFADSWTTVSPQIRAAMPADYLSCNLHFVGHSYGAAVAWLLALEYLQATPTQRVDYLGLGGPKSLTSGYNGPLPSPAFLLGNVGDGVCFLPPNGVLAVAFALSNAWRFSVPSTWRHYTRNYLFDSGTFLTRPEAGTWDSLPGPDTIALTYNRHNPTTYLQGLLGIYTGNSGGSQSPELISIASAMLNGTAVQLPAVANNPNASANLPAANTGLFLGQDGGVLTPNNTTTIEAISGHLVSVVAADAILSGFGRSDFMSVKVTFFYRDGLGNGFSESWYRNGDLDGIQPVTIATNYLTRRMAITGTTTDFIKARFSQIPANRIVRNVWPYDLPGITPTSGTFNPAHGDEGSDISNTSLNIEKRGGSHTGRMFLRGLPDLIVQKGGQYVPVANFATLMNNFINYMTGSSWLYEAEDTGESVKTGVASVVTNPNGNGSIIITTAVPIFVALPPPAGTLNSNVNASLSGFVWNRNLNGPLVVRVTGASTCESIRPIALSTFRPAPNPQIKVNFGELFTLTGMAVQRAGHRKAGRPFAVSAGRVRNKARG